MQYSEDIKGDIYNLELKGRFTRDDLDISEKIIYNLDQHSFKEMVIDLSLLEFIDSSAIGQFLLFREKMESKEGLIKLLNPKGYVKNMLEVSKFDQIFTIENN